MKKLLIALLISGVASTTVDARERDRYRGGDTHHRYDYRQHGNEFSRHHDRHPAYVEHKRGHRYEHRYGYRDAYRHGYRDAYRHGHGHYRSKHHRRHLHSRHCGHSTGVVIHRHNGRFPVIAGAIIGGVIGSEISHNHPQVGAIAGGVLGATIGREISNGPDRSNHRERETRRF